MSEKNKFESKSPRSDESDESTHESYGIVSLSRCEGSHEKLFGSSIKDHRTYVSLRIMHGKKIHNLSQDWYSVNGRTPIIKVDMSAAQFAELITTMNIGDGVPCTIRSQDGVKMDKPPDDDDMEIEKIRSGFKGQTKELANKLEKFRSEVETLFEGKSVTKKDREEILKQLSMFIQAIHSDIPFVLDQFEEAAERVVTTAKAEVDAFVTHSVMRAGIESIENKKLQSAAESQVPQLEGVVLP